MSTVARRWRPASRGAAALFVLGMVGVSALAVSTVPAIRALPEFETASFPLLLAVAAANSTLLLAVAVLFGAATAPRVGLHSHVYAWAAGGTPDWAAFRDSLPLAVGLGVALFALTAVLDVAFAPFVQLNLPVLTDAESLRTLAASIPMRLLYGGITEELLLRWGLMAPVTWVVWRGRGLVGTVPDRPSAATAWVAIVLSAVAFGLGHLPALAASYLLTPPLVVRTVVLNAVVGVALGWLFWRRSLEAGMVAHAAFHVALVVVSTALVVLT